LHKFGVFEGGSTETVELFAGTVEFEKSVAENEFKIVA